MQAIELNQRQSGRTLMEVMIALTLGMVILIAITSLFEGNKRTYRTSDDKGRLEEDGRLALNLLAFHVRMAGYDELADSSLLGNYGTRTNSRVAGFEGCTGGFTNPATVARVCTNDAALSDGFLVRYAADAVNANLNGAGLPTDCLGQGIIFTPGVVENRFFVAVNPGTGVQEIYCQGNGGTPPGALNFTSPAQPIVENVVNMNVSYGYVFDTKRTVRSADSFFTAAQIDNPALPDPDVDGLDGPTTPAGALAHKWARVVSAKICLVMRSPNNGVASTPQRYRDCNGALVTAPDRRLYGVFSTVVALRGRTG